MLSGSQLNGTLSTSQFHGTNFAYISGLTLGNVQYNYCYVIFFLSTYKSWHIASWNPKVSSSPLAASLVPTTQSACSASSLAFISLMIGEPRSFGSWRLRSGHASHLCIPLDGVSKLYNPSVTSPTVVGAISGTASAGFYIVSLIRTQRLFFPMSSLSSESMCCQTIFYSMPLEGESGTLLRYNIGARVDKCNLLLGRVWEEVGGGGWGSVSTSGSGGVYVEIGGDGDGVVMVRKSHNLLLGGRDYGSSGSDSILDPQLSMSVEGGGLITGFRNLRWDEKGSSAGL
ncbi:hypothetical protein Tco_0842347 [Tanacetum coccineum]|uniref:Uncharacterized protein n=1 Tax=Tanacetum coccineum TaxID=301880 RepID=A0ABQ5AZK3_9ASTR